MKLIPVKTHDYYDGLINQFGYSDEGNTYLRSKQIIHLGSRTRGSLLSETLDGDSISHPLKFLYSGIPQSDLYISNSQHKRFQIKFFRILFCGKLYSGLLFQRDVLQGFNPTKHFVYDFETLDELFKVNNLEYTEDYSKWNNSLRTLGKKYLTNYFNVIDCTELAAQLKIVTAYTEIFTGDFETLSNQIGFTIDGELKELEFYRVIDAFTAIQEISMWVDGTLAYPGNLPIEIEDKYKIAAHGFDHKYAFKTEPTKMRK
jgi:hypothetical protein